MDVSINLSTIITAVIGSLVALVGFFVRREMNRTTKDLDSSKKDIRGLEKRMEAAISAQRVKDEKQDKEIVTHGKDLEVIKTKLDAMVITLGEVKEDGKETKAELREIRALLTSMAKKK